MKITKARLKQIIMEEIKNFIVTEQEDAAKTGEVVNDMIDDARKETDLEKKKAALEAAAEVADVEEQ
tara:strand:+ start:517 stop:717 length:201 start_codon:yes stop_codon:yes gene_type:complete